MQERIYSILVDQNEISWKTIILGLIRSEEMDPWDVDISILTKKYINHLKQLKEQDLKVSGKVLLAAAILLRVKSTRLVGDDLNEFDRLIAGSDLSEEQFYDDLEQELARGEAKAIAENLELLPRLPQARRRKVSVFDLVKALEKALEVKQRRVWGSVPPPLPLPTRKFDVTGAMTGLFQRMNSLFKAHGTLSFKKLLPSDSKQDKIYTFIPMLHLVNEEKIDVEQEHAFGDIKINIAEGAQNVQ